MNEDNATNGTPHVSTKNLSVHFGLGRKLFGKKLVVRAVENISLDIPKGSFFGLVGESGSGKTTLGRAILKAAPISKAVFARDTIRLLKLMSMTVSTKELLSGPDADRILRDELLKATREALDAAFIDPANSGVANQQPASITDGLTALTATGTMKTDIEAMVGAFEGDLSRAVFVGSPELFVKINGDTYPNIGARGGELAGVPAIASTGLPDDGSGKHRLVLLDPGQIIYTGMETATLKSSEAGTIEMSDTPTGDGTTSTGAELVSLFQCNAVAVAAMIEANWERQREAAVVLLEEIN